MTNLIRIAALAAAALPLSAAPAVAQPSPSMQAPAPTQPARYVFSHHAAHNGINELMLSYLALQKSTNPHVRQFSQMMIDHHGTATAQLMKMMGDNPMPLPIAPRADQVMAMGRLNGLTGEAFDRAYFEHQIQAHRAAVELYELGGRSGATQELAHYAQAHLPLLRAHLQIAQMMQQHMMMRR